MSRLLPIAAAALLTLSLAEPAAARRVEWGPATDISGHADAYGEVGFGVGILSVGFGPTVGYRAGFGGRVEGALGTMVLASGGSLGAGYSARVVDGAYFTLELPLMLHGLIASVGPINFGSDCPESECGADDGQGVTAVALATGVDMLFGSSRTNGGRFILGLRGGLFHFIGKASAVMLPLPVAQMNFGVTF